MKKLLSVLSSTLQGGVRGGLFFLALLTTTSLWAYDFQSGDLYYNITSDSTVAVTYQKYNSSYASIYTVTVPETITYDGTTYSVTSIGNYAFYGCSSLTSVTIGESVTSIGEEAFYGCSSLTSITIPNSVTSIGRVAFFDCSSLTSVTIPNSVTSIGPGAFVGCTSITKTNYTGNIASWCDISFGNEFANPIYYSKNLYIDKQEVKDLVIPNTVNSIRDYTFSYCSSLTSITIPNSVTSIGDEAFRSCSSLTSITIPESVTSIGSSTFIGCYFLKENFINNSSLDAEANNYWDATFVDTEIDGLLIRDNTIIRCRPYVISATIPDNVTSIGDYAFSGHSSLTSVTIPNSVTSIGNRTFSGCSSLTSITIPNSVTSIGSYAFSGCYRVIAITVESGNTIYDSRDNCNAIINTATNKLIAGCQNTFIPNSVTSIGNYAFYGCLSLTSVTIPNSVTSIGYEAFRDCSSLTSVTIPNSVTSIGEWAFADCSSLTSVTIPNSVTSIGEWAFADCSSLSTVFWNANLYDNNYTYWCLAYYWDSIDSVYMIDPELGIFDIGRFVEENMPFNEEEMCNDSPFNGCDGIKSFSFGENVEVIPDGICYGLDGITSITIPESVSSIGERSFAECSSLDTIYCYSLTPPVIHDSYLTLLFDVGEHGASSRYEYMYYAPYIYDNITLCVPCQALEKYKSQEEYTIRFKNIQCSEDTTPPEPEIPTEGIGVFSIGEGKTVTFSRGNLQYTQSTDTWSFAENQWDMIGTDNVIGGSVESNQYGGYYKYGDALADKIDLFGWSTSAANFGVEILEDYDYSDSFVDWGTNTIGNDTPNTWRTLSYNEWSYLRNTRVNADALCGVAQVNGVSGLVFLPDNWACPDGVTFKSGFHSDDSKEAYGQYQTFTADQWSKLESAGAVFLPAAGHRSGSVVAGVQNCGYYWSAREKGINYVYSLGFRSDEASMGYLNHLYGRSVRLVKDISNTTPEPPTQPQDTTIYHPTEYVAICEGDVFNWRGWQITEAGTYTDLEIVEDENYTYHHIYTLELTVIPFSSDTIVVEAYDSYVWHGRVYTESGVYLYEEYCYQEILELTIIDTPTPPSELQDTIYYADAICEGETYIWWGMEFTETGTYTCIYEEIVEDEDYTYIYRHLHILYLTVLPYETIEYEVEAYDSFEWHGIVYTESGTHTYQSDECTTEVLYLTIIPSEDKEYVYEHHNYLVCDADIFVDPITGSTHVISSLIPFSLTWSDTIIGTNIDTIHTFNITPIVAPEPLTEDILYAIGAVPELVAGEMVNTMGTTEPIMWYYQMNDKDDIADVIGVEWVAGHDVVLNTEQTTHTMVLEVWDECYNTRSMKFTFPVSKKDSEPQDTTIYITHTAEMVTICEGETYIWMGKTYTEAGTYRREEIVEDENYIYHIIYTLELTVIPPEIVVLSEEAYDSYEWHGMVYTESGVYKYEEWCYQEILELTIIPSQDNQGEVVVEPSTNSVTITWQKEDDADTYIIVIKQGEKVVCTLIFDAEGNLVSVNYLPGRESNKHGIQHAGLTSDSFQYTITGLTPSTDYTYTVTATDDSDNTISSYSGEFTTHHATSVENTNSQSPTIDCQKILYEDHIYILRDGKTYTIMGQEI